MTRMATARAVRSTQALSFTATSTAVTSPMRTRKPPSATAMSSVGETRAAQESESGDSSRLTRRRRWRAAADQAPRDPQISRLRQHDDRRERHAALEHVEGELASRPPRRSVDGRSSVSGSRFSLGSTARAAAARGASSRRRRPRTASRPRSRSPVRTSRNRKSGGVPSQPSSSQPKKPKMTGVTHQLEGAGQSLRRTRCSVRVAR